MRGEKIMTDNKDPDVEFWLNAIDREALIYNWHLKSLGYDVENKIEKLEESVYTEIWEDVDREILWQRDIDD